MRPPQSLVTSTLRYKLDLKKKLLFYCQNKYPGTQNITHLLPQSHSLITWVSDFVVNLICEACSTPHHWLTRGVSQRLLISTVSVSSVHDGRLLFIRFSEDRRLCKNDLKNLIIFTNNQRFLIQSAHCGRSLGCHPFSQPLTLMLV